MGNSKPQPVIAVVQGKPGRKVGKRFITYNVLGDRLRANDLQDGDKA
jgi:hypothetical protein